MNLRSKAAVLAMPLVLAACATMNGGDKPDYAALVAAPDRSEADRKTDERRRPVKLLEFTGVRAGMRVLDMGAGGGYSTELMARAVGSGGIVYAQDAPGARGAERLESRAKGASMHTVVRLARAFDDPLPAEVGALDLVTFFFAYHDTAYMPVDRARMNRRLFEVLKPGGHLVIADHSARVGDGISMARTLHRIEESVVREELEAAGFRHADAGGFLRNPADPRDVIVFKSPVPVDEFVLKFERPK